MKGTIKKITMNPWTVSVGSGLIVLLVTVIIDFISAEQIFSTIMRIINSIMSLISAFVNFELKVGWVLVFLGVLIFALWARNKYVAQKQAMPALPKFYEYTQDTILEYTWRWSWEKNYYGKYNIVGLHAICSECETKLVDNRYGYGGRYVCLRCNNSTSLPMPDVEHVEILILDNVRRKYFQNK